MIKIIFKLTILILIWPIINSHANDWGRSHANNSSNKYSQESQINVSTIKDLKLDWIYHSGDLSKSNDTVQTNPIIAGDTLVTTTVEHRVVGIDPVTGKKKWSLKLPYFYVGRRGLESYKNSVFIPIDEGVIAIDANTGKVNKSFGLNGKFGAEVSLVPPIVHKDKNIIIINASGSIESFGLTDGKPKWRTSLHKGGVNPRIWSGASYDPESEVIFLNTSDANGLIGGYVGNGGYACSVVAISAATGKILWSFQETIHDVWDLDLSGPPILTSLSSGKTQIPAVISVSKTGNVLLLDRRNGKPIYGFSYINTPGSQIPGEILSPVQKNFTLPTPFSSIEYNPIVELQGASVEKLNAINKKIQNARFEKYSPPSLLNSVVMFGLHGGAEWPGATLNPSSNILYIPSNRYPWIIRTSYFDKNSSISIANLKKHGNIQEKCGVCHGQDLQGLQQSEIEGDAFSPSLIGYSSNNRIKNIEDFKSIHNFSYNSLLSMSELTYNRLSKDNLSQLYLYLKNLNNKLVNFIFIKITHAKLFLTLNSIDSTAISDFNNAIRVVDADIRRRNDLGIRAFWQLLLDKNKLPGSNPPWGLLSSIDLNTGKLNWQTPLGKIYDPDTKRYISGDMNFGGVISTAGGLIFATGTRDEMARAFDATSGKELWSAKLPAAGSSPPMTYTYQGCQYIIFTATGGRFVGFKKFSDTTVAYKLQDCKPHLREKKQDYDLNKIILGW